MSVSRLRFDVPLALSFCLVATMAKAETRGPVAIVYSLTGEAALTAPGAAPRPLRLFDRVAAGTILKAGPGARLALAFATGKLYEISGPAHATLGKGDLAERSGGVSPLPATPPLPCLSPISAGDRPGRRAGAVRIRSESMTGLYPNRGVTTLAKETVLRFQPVAGTPRYRVEVQDDQGAVVYSTGTAATRVSLPANTLRPGAGYHWSVRTMDRSGPVAQGEAEFSTLDAETAQARGTLRLLAMKTGGDLMALLAGVDQQLGLLAEARTELRSALRAAPLDTALGEALTELERHMEEAGFATED